MKSALTLVAFASGRLTVDALPVPADLLKSMESSGQSVGLNNTSVYRSPVGFTSNMSSPVSHRALNLEGVWTLDPGASFTEQAAFDGLRAFHTALQRFAAIANDQLSDAERVEYFGREGFYRGASLPENLAFLSWVYLRRSQLGSALPEFTASIVREAVAAAHDVLPSARNISHQIALIIDNSGVHNALNHFIQNIIESIGGAVPADQDVADYAAAIFSNPRLRNSTLGYFSAVSNGVVQAIFDASPGVNGVSAAIAQVANNQEIHDALRSLISQLVISVTGVVPSADAVSDYASAIFNSPHLKQSMSGLLGALIYSGGEAVLDVVPNAHNVSLVIAQVVNHAAVRDALHGVISHVVTAVTGVVPSSEAVADYAAGIFNSADLRDSMSNLVGSVVSAGAQAVFDGVPNTHNLSQAFARVVNSPLVRGSLQGIITHAVSSVTGAMPSSQAVSGYVASVLDNAELRGATSDYLRALFSSSGQALLEMLPSAHNITAAISEFAGNPALREALHGAISHLVGEFTGVVPSSSDVADYVTQIVSDTQMRSAIAQTLHGIISTSGQAFLALVPSAHNVSAAIVEIAGDPQVRTVLHDTLAHILTAFSEVTPTQAEIDAFLSKFLHDPVLQQISYVLVKTLAKESISTVINVLADLPNSTNQKIGENLAQILKPTIRLIYAGGLISAGILLTVGACLLCCTLACCLPFFRFVHGSVDAGVRRASGLPSIATSVGEDFVGGATYALYKRSGYAPVNQGRAQIVDSQGMLSGMMRQIEQSIQSTYNRNKDALMVELQSVTHRATDGVTASIESSLRGEHFGAKLDTVIQVVIDSVLSAVRTQLPEEGQQSGISQSIARIAVGDVRAEVLNMMTQDRVEEFAPAIENLGSMLASVIKRKVSSMLWGAAPEEPQGSTRSV